jgi:sodium/bile acid cotransporter 7
MDWVTSYGVSVVFFLYGLTLAPERMRAGFMRWPVHLAVQLGTFVLFPVVVLALSPLLHLVFPPEIVLGFFYVAALPATVSSSIGMTSLARGNVPVAVFNATLSSLLGVVVTPLLMAWYVSSTGGHFELGPVIFKVVILMMLPIILGQLLHLPLYSFTSRHAQGIKHLDRAIILAIIYGSFSDSVLAGVWGGQDPLIVIELVVACVVLFFIIYGVMKIVCRVMGFNREDSIACLFCASKKSLATGVPLSKVMFGATPQIGLIIAPLMLFHFLQLVIVSIIASRYERDGKSAP